MRFIRVHPILVLLAVICLFAALCAVADDSPLRQPDQSSGLEPSGDDAAARARIAELLRKELGEEPSPGRVTDALSRARRIRAEAEQQAKDAEAIAAREIAAAIRQGQALREDLEHGSALAVLRAITPGPFHPFELLEASEEFGRVFEARAPGLTVDGATLDPAGSVPNGAILTYPAGVYSLRFDRLRPGEGPTGDLTIQGAGMDKTLVRLGEPGAIRTVSNLTLRDLTIDTGNSELVDARGNDPVAIRLQRCRILGYDSGAGGSVMIRARTAALLAEDSAIEGGYGRGGDGNPFRVDGVFLARLDRCTIKGPIRSVYYANDYATYLFSDCQFADLAPSLRTAIESPPDGVRFERCTAAYLDEKEPRPPFTPSRRNIADLGFDWSSDPVGLFVRQSSPYAHPFDFLSGDGFLALFKLPERSPKIQFGDLARDTPVPDGATVILPAGICSWSPDRLGRRPTMPPTIALQGAGMDKTLLRLAGRGLLPTVLTRSGSGGGRVAAQVVVLRDMTIDCGNDEMVGSRGCRVFLRLQRCRVVGFDSGAGGSDMLAGDGMAFCAEDSVFECGYGRGLTGDLFDVRGPLLARLDRCVLRGAFRHVFPRSADATCLFTDCKLLDVALSVTLPSEGPMESARLINCTAEYAKGLPVGRSLADVNPDWAEKDE
jgi:hypothetical protein